MCPNNPFNDAHYSPPLTIRDCFRWGRDYLTQQQETALDGALNDEDMSVVIQFILASVFNQKYARLLGRDVLIEAAVFYRIKSHMDRYLNGEPLAYILREAGFCSRHYYVRKGVLIPRPETEELVALSASFIRQSVGANANARLLECGVGSGVISIELAKQFPNVSVIGWDISPVAIAVTKKNMHRHQVSNVTVIHGDFFASYTDYLHDDMPVIMVANPPYIDQNEPLSVVVKQEPPEALFAPMNGQLYIRQLMDIALGHQLPLMAEIGHDQAEKLRSDYPSDAVTFKNDWSGHARFVMVNASV